MALKVNIIRPDDLLVLEIEGQNLWLDQSVPGNPAVIPEDATKDAFLIVQFPPQSIAEEAVFERNDALRDDFPQDGAESSAEEAKRRELENKQLEAAPSLGATLESLLKVRPLQARSAQQSRLVFRIPANSNLKIPYTVEGLLNWENLELSVSGVAAISDPPASEEVANAPAIAPPSDTETALEMPYRLMLSPNQKVGWQHVLLPKTHAGRTELWHTQLVFRDGEDVTELSHARPAPLRAIWSPDYVSTSSLPEPSWPALGAPEKWALDAPDRLAGQPVLTAMNPRDRHELVILTSAFQGFVKSKNNFSTYLPSPIYAEQVMLSSLGGWLKSRGSWDPPLEWIPPPFRIVGDLLPNRERLFEPLKTPVTEPASVNPPPDPPVQETAPGGEPQIVELRRPARVIETLGQELTVTKPPPGDEGTPLNISEWVHTATQGRDHYVRIVYEGYLFPFGHRAALVKVTERKFKNAGGPVAYLSQRMQIVVRQPLKEYMKSDDTQEALPNEGRGMPLKQVRLTTLVTPDVDPPEKIGGTEFSFWIKVGGNHFRFHAVGRDGENTDGKNHAVDFTAALIFVPYSDAKPANISSTLEKIREEYRGDLLSTRRQGARRACLVPGQAITYAESDGNSTDNTTLTTQALYFDADSAVKAKFLPKLEKAKVTLAAVEQLVGTAATTEIKYYPAYVAQGFDDGNGVFAELINPVKTAFSADKAGGIATPNVSFTGLTRKLGPVAGEDLSKAATNQFVPSDIFGDDSATLFGKLKLKDLIADGDFSNAPSIQSFPQGNSLSVKLEWTPKMKMKDPPDAGFMKFGRQDDSELKICALIVQPSDGNEGSLGR